MHSIYMSKETIVGGPVTVSVSKEQMAIHIEDQMTKQETIAILSAEEAMKLAFAIAEHFSEKES